MKSKSQAEVFIIETLTFKDENKNRFEGRIISDILHLSEKKCKYYYIRTERELIEVLDIFQQSKYRYLHLSCHGNDEAVSTTLDKLPFKNLGKLLRPYLCNRRLFLSACSVVNKALARELMVDSGCYSILGPKQDIAYSSAAILWASLYNTMFAEDDASMQHSMLRQKSQEVANMFQVRMRYVRRDLAEKEGFKIFEIDPEEQEEDEPKSRKK